MLYLDSNISIRTQTRTRSIIPINEMLVGREPYADMWVQWLIHQNRQTKNINAMDY